MSERAALRASKVWRVALLLALLAFVPAATVQAAPPLHGALEARALFELPGRVGGALTADIWWGQGWVRGGLGLGVAALSSEGKASSRVLTPLGLSLSFAPPDDLRSGPLAVLRVGIAPGAEKGGFVLAGWGSGALGYRLALGEGASVRLGGEAWLLLGSRGGLFLGPFVGLGF